MKKSIFIAIIFFVYCFAIGAGSAKSQASDNSHSAVIMALNKYDDAWSRKDVNAVAAILAKNYTYFTSTGSTMSREPFLDLLRSPKYILKSAKRSDVFGVNSGNTFVLGSRWVGNGSYNGEAFNDDQRCSLVFTRENKEWKLLSEHCTQIVSK